MNREKIVLVLDTSSDEVLDSSDPFTIDKNWKKDKALILKIKEFVNRANVLTKSQENNFDAFVCVDVIFQGNEDDLDFKFSSQVEAFIEELADQTCN